MKPQVTRLNSTELSQEHIALLNKLAEQRVIGARWTTEQRLALWNWKYVRNPEKIGQAASVWVCRWNKKLCGQLGAVLTSFKIYDKEVAGGWLADFGLIPELQRQGVGRELVRVCGDEVGFILGYRLSDASYKLFIKMGWTYLGDVPIYQRVLRPNLGYGIKAFFRMTYFFAASMFEPRKYLITTAKIINRFDSRVDVVWEQMATEISCSVKRNCAYLNWRYVDIPGNDYILFVVTRCEKHVGYAVVCQRGHEGRIVDFVVPPSDVLAVQNLLRAAVSYLYLQAVSVITCAVTDVHIQDLLSSHGFHPQTKGYRFLYSKDVNVGSIGLKLNDWFLTHGDCDLDLPN
jgi:GNAT superfamily N-acetyltransferase